MFIVDSLFNQRPIQCQEPKWEITTILLSSGEKARKKNESKPLLKYWIASFVIEFSIFYKQYL